MGGMKALLPLVLLAAFLGRGDRAPMAPAAPPHTTNLVAQGVQMQGVQMQGLHLRGAELRGVRLDSLRLRGERLADVRIDGAELVARLPSSGAVLRGAALAGAELLGESTAGEPVPLALGRIAPDPVGGGEIFLYELRYRAPWGLAPACRADATGDQRALPLRGIWDARGARRDSQELFTFACTSGVLAKCVRWGYQPWRSVAGRSLVDHHQACTRLARADYCGNGRSHTRDGTLVDIYDDLGIQVQDPDGGLFFEAAWTPDGAYCVSKARLGILPLEVLFGCPERLSLPALADLGGPDRCALRIDGRARADVLLSNRSFALLR